MCAASVRCTFPSRHSPGNGRSRRTGLLSRASFFFFFFFALMEVVSHLLFEACRKIIAQLQAAVAERMGWEGGWDCKEEEKGGI